MTLESYKCRHSELGKLSGSSTNLENLSIPSMDGGSSPSRTPRTPRSPGSLSPSVSSEHLNAAGQSSAASPSPWFHFSPTSVIATLNKLAPPANPKRIYEQVHLLFNSSLANDIEFFRS